MVNCSADLSGVYSLWETLSPWIVLYLTIGFGVFSLQSIRFMISAIDNNYSLKYCKNMTLSLMLMIVLLWWVGVIFSIKRMVASGIRTYRK